MSLGNFMKLMACLSLTMLFAVNSFAQKVTIHGDVKSKEGKAIEAATVRVDGVNGSVVYTEEDGTFSIPAKVGNHIIVERVGYKPENILVKADNDAYHIVLEESASSLDEVVVTASGSQIKKREQGYVSNTVNGAELTLSKPSTVGGGLAGKVPGLDISAVGGGVNPDYRLVLRGQRSITGNNNALIVLDNVIVPSEIFNNINPEDVESIQVLNGPAGVALYGSQASNGALIITTKRGKAGPPVINVSNTLTLTSVAFNPKLQKEFGSGLDDYGIDENGNPLLTMYENQSYGPRYNGEIIALGEPLEDGSQQYAKYAYFEDRTKFWQTGLTNQTDVSLSQADDKSSTMFSAQYLDTKGVTWLDKYKRASVRLNGSRNFLPNLSIDYQASYVQNRYDVTAYIGSVYDNYLNMPGWVPVTKYKNWRTDPFANPNGYYNPWYSNPYFYIENNRSYTNNDYLLGNIALKYSPFTWMTIRSTTGLEARTITNKVTTGKFDYTDYAIEASGNGKSDILGYDYEYSMNSSQIFQTVNTEFRKKVNDLNFTLSVQGDLKQNYLKYLYGAVSGLSDSSIFNLSNSLNTPSAGNGMYKARQLGLAYEFKIGYKGYLFLHTTGRNDWVSILDPGDRSFFYPAVDLSFVATDALPFLQEAEWLDVLKFRGGWSKVGMVNLKDYTYGAYATQPTFSQANGYPYSGIAGYSVGSTIVQSGLKPEITKQIEVGTDFTLLKGKIDGSFTYYSSTTDNQTILTNISNATGFTYYLSNAGKTSNSGVEARLTYTALDTKNWTVNLSGTYAYQNSKVNYLNSTLSRLSLATYSSAGSYAVPHMQFPQIYGSDYERDDEGHVIVDATTGMPSVGDYKYFGNADPHHIVGFTPSIRYKSFSITAVFEYRGGMIRYNGIGSNLAWSGMGINTVKYNRENFVFPNSVYLDKDGEYVKNTDVVVNQGNSGFWTGVYRSVSSNFITSGNYMKLRQLSISYNFPQSILKGLRAFKAASLSLQGRNLFIWLPKENVYTDPEYSNAGSDSNGIGLTGVTSPPQRYYGATLSLTF
ncbi:SusC/RagA family TonB-linked outer membrane protein [Parafilimonas sp.]|uniref:SusC/RagA family TonB-linked outer membrane protein n=1 Tax=Parafilimonas sp. TaxID=1969739 RepID=UPI0039E3BD0A